MYKNPTWVLCILTVNDTFTVTKKSLHKVLGTHLLLFAFIEYLEISGNLIWFGSCFERKVCLWTEVGRRERQSYFFLTHSHFFFTLVSKTRGEKGFSSWRAAVGERRLAQTSGEKYEWMKRKCVWNAQKCTIKLGFHRPSFYNNFLIWKLYLGLGERRAQVRRVLALMKHS